jgi:SHS2 domain-containing protein
MTGASWEHFPHDADIGVRGRGPTPSAAFEQAALALTAVIADPTTVRPLERVAIECQAPDLELLLYDWLNRLVHEMAVGGMLFSRFEVECGDTRLVGAAFGEPVDPPRHCPAVEVKGATMTELQVRPDGDGGWIAQCVVDV